MRRIFEEKIRYFQSIAHKSRSAVVPFDTVSYDFILWGRISFIAFFVLDGGKIVERGNHEKLLSEDGAYAKLWSAQAEYYKDTAGDLFA